MVGAFNHAITYVPKLNMYLDGTASHYRFGTLPNSDAGKPVLLVACGALANTPHADLKTDTVLNRVEMTLKADGSISGRSEIIATGAIESNLRAQIASVPANQKDKLITRLMGNKGEGSYVSSSPNDLALAFTCTAKYEIKDAVTIDSPGAFPLPLPDNLKVAALPKDVTHKGKTFSFEARYKQDGQKIPATRKLICERAQEYCDPSM